MKQYIVVVRDTENYETACYGPFESEKVAHAEAFKMESLPDIQADVHELIEPEKMSDRETVKFYADNYSLVCSKHPDLALQAWARAPMTKVRLARLIRDGEGWDLRRILDAMKSEQYADL